LFLSFINENNPNYPGRAIISNNNYQRVLETYHFISGKRPVRICELTSLPRQCEVPCLDQLQSPAALSSREEMHTNSSRFIFHLEQ
jgi:hypothetical protein